MKEFAGLDLEKFQQSKLYDFLMAIPLMLWFGYGVVQVRPALSYVARQVLSDPTNLYYNLHFFSLFATGMFDLLTVYMLVVRDKPIRRARGWLPRACGFVGSFLGVGILYLKPVTLPFAWQCISAGLIFVGGVGSTIAMSNLGKSFSIMPEARTLVTRGPYAYVRHPLYAAEIVTIAGSAVQFQQPWAVMLMLGVMLLLLVRSYFEEQVLVEAYPEYAQYQARVKRFGFL